MPANTSTTMPPTVTRPTLASTRTVSLTTSPGVAAVEEEEGAGLTDTVITPPTATLPDTITPVSRLNHMLYHNSYGISSINIESLLKVSVY